MQLDQPMLFLGSRDYYLNINGNVTSFKNVDTDPVLRENLNNYITPYIWISDMKLF